MYFYSHSFKKQQSLELFWSLHKFYLLSIMPPNFTYFDSYEIIRKSFQIYSCEMEGEFSSRMRHLNLDVQGYVCLDK